MTTKAPVRDTPFTPRELACLEAAADLPGFEAANADTAKTISDRQH